MIFTEKISAISKKRPELEKLFSMLRKDDTLVVWKLDRFARSVRDLIFLIKRLEKKGADFHSIQNNLDTSTATGKYFFYVFAALGELETNLISERTKVVLAAARARGRKGGRPPGFTKETISKIKVVKILHDKTIQEIANDLSISKASAYGFLNTAKEWELENLKYQ